MRPLPSAKKSGDVATHPADRCCTEKVADVCRQFRQALCRISCRIPRGAGKRILDTQAGVFYGREAIDAGLADEIAPFGDAVAMLAAEIDKRQQKKIYGGASMEGMTTQERMEKLLGADDGQQAIAELGYIKKVDAEKQQSEALASATSNNELLEKLQICQIASLTIDQTMKLIGEDQSLEEMRKTIQSMKAATSQQTTVTSTITPMSAGEKNPLIAACEAVSQSMAK